MRLIPIFVPLLTISVSLLVTCGIAECSVDDAHGLCNGQSSADTEPHDEVVLPQVSAPSLLHQSKLNRTQTNFEHSRPCKGSGEYLSKGEGNEDFWRCTGGYCIPGSYRCNGIKECKDGSDELMCVPVLAANVRQLSSQLSQQQKDQQTGAANHSSGHDEKNKTKRTKKTNEKSAKKKPEPDASKLSSNESNVADDAPMEDTEDREDFSGGLDLQSQLDALRNDWMHSEGSSSRDDDLQSQVDALRHEVQALKQIIRSNGNASKDTDSLWEDVEASEETVHGEVGGDENSKTETSGRTQANKSSLDASLIADEIAALNANMASSDDELDGSAEIVSRS